MGIEIHIFSTFHQHFSFILPHLAAAWGWLCKPSSGYHRISMSKLENTMFTLNKNQYFSGIDWIPWNYRKHLPHLLVFKEDKKLPSSDACSVLLRHSLYSCKCHHFWTSTDFWEVRPLSISTNEFLCILYLASYILNIDIITTDSTGCRFWFELVLMVRNNVLFVIFVIEFCQL